MAGTSFIRAFEAAAIAGIEVSEIGVEANNFVRKKELLATGKFLPTLLQKYGDDSFILTKDVAKGTVIITVAVDDSIIDRATVQIGNDAGSTSVSKEVMIGTEITVNCNFKEGDVFEGWYSGDVQISTEASYTFEVTEAVNFIAKVNYIDISPETLSFNNGVGEQSIDIESNVDWEIIN